MIHAMKDRDRITAIIYALRHATRSFPEPAANAIVREYGQDPFLVLASCILSLRTQDKVSLPASRRLFERAKTPAQLLKLSQTELERIIYPVGFYRQKSRQLRQMSHELITRFAGCVPQTEDELLSLPGVGRKTMALVLGVGFGIPAICVDTHVHRISNRLGIIKTSTPAATEEALKQIIPREFWIEYNRLLVVWGQNICVPISPFCSICPIAPLCQRVGVTKSR